MTAADAAWKVRIPMDADPAQIQKILGSIDSLAEFIRGMQPA